jgi:UDP-N-acetylmuramoyl-L-alanyl-D-glutamate--2,6-diaminopimelate ligase
MKVIGVTGTDGKTTTVQLIAGILEEAGKKVALASTINFKIDGEELANESKFTTLSSFQVQKFIKKSAESGCEYLVLETSSHALDQYRVWGIKYATAVVTNVTREHLDYHKDIENYRLAKLRLFFGAKNAVVNLDMEKPEDFWDCRVKNVFGSTTENKNSKITMRGCNSKLRIIKAKNIRLEMAGSAFDIENVSYRLNLPGLFNIENALAAVCVGISENIDLETIKRALEKIKGIPGRMESIPNDRGINIIVDFALTPHALSRLYDLINRMKKQEAKVIGVFGACGERDRGKRPLTGKIVSEHADYAIVTDDEPYHEDPKKIIEEISAGIENKIEGKDFWKISDRREAIKKALALARAGDFVAVTGMGAENTRGVGGQKIPWNDKAVILEELKNI